MYKTTSNINVSILDGMGTIYHVANTRLYNQNRKYHVLEVGFPSVNQGKGSSLPLRDALARVSGTAATAPWIVRDGPSKCNVD